MEFHSPSKVCQQQQQQLTEQSLPIVWDLIGLGPGFPPQGFSFLKPKLKLHACARILEKKKKQTKTLFFF